MSWIKSLIILLGGISVLMLLGPPVAVALLDKRLRRNPLSWRLSGLKQLACIGFVVEQFFATPIPFFILMGEVLFHTVSP